MTAAITISIVIAGSIGAAITAMLVGLDAGDGAEGGE